MNSQSSRSHAIFTLYLEHRWSIPIHAGKKRIKCKRYMSKTSSFNLVDLAGSERQSKTGNSGKSLEESIHINLGLFALKKVINALLRNQKGDMNQNSCVEKSAHVPYRDSMLTQYLRNSLGGNCFTLMIACCHTSEEHQSEAQATISYASFTEALRNKPSIIINEKVKKYDPPEDEIEDHLNYNRHCCFITTTNYGSIFARCAGTRGAPLLLFIHGSGPKNSSARWNGTVKNFLCKAEQQNRNGDTRRSEYFLVAIDCNGYGKSAGDRQTIRSYPGAFVEELVHALGYNHAYSIIGASQGACATFNAILQKPNLAKTLCVVRPVGHDVKRYAAIKQPSLLIFEIEDAGHPVKVGRLMKKYMPQNTCNYYEYSSKAFPTWYDDNFVKVFLAFLRSSRVSVKCPLGSWTGTSIPNIKIVGGFRMWKNPESKSKGIPSSIETHAAVPLISTTKSCNFQNKESEIVPTKTRETACDNECLTFTRLETSFTTTTETLSQGTITNPWVACMSSRGTLQYKKDGLRITVKPPGVTVSNAPSEDANLFGVTSMDENYLNQANRSHELQQRLCMLCGSHFVFPLRLQKCRHIFCKSCVCKCLKTTRQCPLRDCLEESSTKNCNNVLLDKELFAEISSCRYAEGTLLCMKNAKQNVAPAQKLCGLYDIIIVVEYGNTAQESKNGLGKYNVEAFFSIKSLWFNKKRIKSNNFSVISKRSAISKVEFDINPQYPKSAVRVTKSPFVLARCMASRFPCNMKVMWKNKILPDIKFQHQIQHEKGRYCRRVALVTKAGKSWSKQREILCNGDSWILEL